jgi:tRNA 2-thiouridine synthesizing protein B
MQLHQINQLAYPATLEATWQDSVNAGDQILLIEEGFLRTQQSDAFSSTLKQMIEKKEIALYYLQSDATAYGLASKIGVSLSDEAWVDMTFSANSNISW